MNQVTMIHYLFLYANNIRSALDSQPKNADPCLDPLPLQLHADNER